MGRWLTSPCSRRAAARPRPRRGGDEPRPAAEGQRVMRAGPKRERVAVWRRSWARGIGVPHTVRRERQVGRAPAAPRLAPSVRADHWLTDG